MMPSQNSNANSRTDERPESLLIERDVARVLQMSLAAIRRWRLLNFGPPFIKLGGSVRYDPRALRDWLASRPGGGEGPQAVANG